MKRCIVGVCTFCLVAGLMAGVAFSLTIGVKVSPNVIVLRSQTHALTVHTTIQLSQVASGTVQLNGTLAPTATFADDRGNLVAKFSMDAVKDLVCPPSATLTLTGTTVDGEQFEGTDTVDVKDH